MNWMDPEEQSSVNLQNTIHFLKRKCIPYCSQNVSHFVWAPMCDIGVPVSIKRRSFQVWIPIIKMVMRPSYLYSRDSYTGKTTSLYKEIPLFSKWYSVKPGIALLKWPTKAGEWMQLVFRLSYYWIKAWHQVLLHWWDRVVFVHMESSPNVVSWGCQRLWFSGMSVMTNLFYQKLNTGFT